MLIGAVALALGAAAIPLALGILELGHLRGSIARIEQAVSDVKLARDVIDKTSQSLVNFTAVALELSPADRSQVRAEAERQFNELDLAVDKVIKSSSNALSLRDQQRLSQAVVSLKHSWEELRDQAPGEISPVAKRYHFSRILEQIKLAKHLLLTFEAETSQAAQGEAAASFQRLSRSAVLLVSTMLLGSLASVAALFGIYHFARRTKDGNDRLKAAIAAAERAEYSERAAHARLREACDAIPEGFVLFDADDRYVMWNRRFAELHEWDGYKITSETRFEDTLRAGMKAGRFPEAEGQEEEWLAARLARHRQPENEEEQLLHGNRWLKIMERRTSDGGSVGIRIEITDLKRKEASFRLLFDSHPLPMFLWDRNTFEYLAVNDAACQHYGYSREQFMKMTSLDIRSKEDQALLRNTVANAAPGEVRSDRVWRHIKADGSPIDVIIYAKMLPYEGHLATLSVAVDVTERRRAEKELRRTRSFLDAVVENMPAILFVKEPQEHRYVLINRAGEEFFGMPSEEIVGKTDFDLLSSDEASLSFVRDLEVLHGAQKHSFDEETIATRDHGERLIATRRLTIPGDDDQSQYLLGVAEDITERKKDQERIAHLAHYDALTDLPNRAAFTKHLGSAIEQADANGQMFAVLCLDLDRFKEINDTYGHLVGDGLLQEVARRLQSAAEGAFVARLGGDEFTLVATGPQPASAEALAQRLLGEFANDFVIDGQRLRNATSIGVAIYPTDGLDAMTVVGNADAALYRAKAEGRGSVRFFEAQMNAHLRERRAMQRDLENAVANGEITLYYQPQMRIGSAITGFEALARWRHPERGWVPPNVFIPLAEESGTILPMGEWILRDACREAASWPRPLNVAINVSPVQFRDGDLPTLVHSILLETGLAPHRLEIEITENVLIGDFSRALSIMRRLKALGVRISMDDFGTGYSSLAYLQAFPFDKIKIDQSFISSVVANPQSAAIVRAVIGLARGLNLPVIAEGVETQEQLSFLSQESCDEVQGYFVGRPSAIDRYGELVGRAREEVRETA
ncbi:MAG TPA: EAL domain-containing protein [Bradyrhizobium sp.]|uniref:sensor domain-containing protein n=1 Tax=Bradyrhizobium sp. TaxID=376 RepID=UPI002D80EBCC|nr:EAL domain-containing protein [Bradyrhizobium sp.]HET7888745.1 EAL domain-containing protein [Bradyrhizobium sp.]